MASTSTDTKDAKAVAPAAPSYLPDAQADKWQDAYSKAFAQAQRDYPDNLSQQRAAAAKAANAMLAVAAPKSAADIDALENWQFLRRETRKIGGVDTRVCVTADGQKYSFPVDTKSSKSAK